MTVWFVTSWDVETLIVRFIDSINVVPTPSGRDRHRLLFVVAVFHASLKSLARLRRVESCASRSEASGKRIRKEGLGTYTVGLASLVLGF